MEFENLDGYQLCHVEPKPWASILREKRVTLRLTQQEVADRAKIKLQQYKQETFSYSVNGIAFHISRVSTECSYAGCGSCGFGPEQHSFIH